jgi:hypothetical protein
LIARIIAASSYFIKLLHSRLLPYERAVIQHYQAASRSIDRFRNKQRIQHHSSSHHLFIVFKAAYDTITKHEIYVIMAELDFPTKLIRLTKTTLTTLSSAALKYRTTVRTPLTPKGLDKETYYQRCFSTLEAIVRRAKLQMTGTIFNKQTQLVAYADDIDIFGRSLEAVRDAYLAAKVGLKINEKRQNT